LIFAVEVLTVNHPAHGFTNNELVCQHIARLLIWLCCQCFCVIFCIAVDWVGREEGFWSEEEKEIWELKLLTSCW